jgi:integrase
MPSVRLTQKFIQSAKTKKIQEDFWDEGLPGFVLRVFKTGKKSYNVTFRTDSRRRGRYNIGDASIVSLVDARAKAREIRLSVEKGEDPSRRRRDLRSANTFKELGKLYLELYCVPRLRPRSVKDIEYALNSHLYPAWGEMKVADIKRSDVITLIERLGVKRKTPVLANHIRSAITGIFRFALERDIVETSPCVGLPRKFSETARARVLTDEEIVEFWKATDKEHHTVRDLFRILLLLGQRSGETRQMRWDQIKGDVWVIPSSITKNKQEQVIPLPTEVQKILALRSKDEDLVFPSLNGQPLKWIYWANERLRVTMKSTTPWRVHDLRRTCATGLEKLGLSDSVISAVLNHNKISRLGVTGRYARHGFVEEKQSALQVWSDFIMRLIKQKNRARIKD